MTKRHITLLTNVLIITTMVLPVVMYGCESLTIKKGECRQIDAFELCCWRRLLRVPWTARRSNWSILKEIDPAYSLEVLIWTTNTLATWWKEPTLWKWPWCWERLKAREGDGRGDGWITSLTQWTWVRASSGRWWWTGNPGMLQSMGLQRVRHTGVTEQPQQQTAVLSNMVAASYMWICLR